LVFVSKCYYAILELCLTRLLAKLHFNHFCIRYFSRHSVLSRLRLLPENFPWELSHPVLEDLDLEAVEGSVQTISEVSRGCLWIISEVVDKELALLFI